MKQAALLAKVRGAVFVWGGAGRLPGRRPFCPARPARLLGDAIIEVLFSPSGLFLRALVYHAASQNFEVRMLTSATLCGRCFPSLLVLLGLSCAEAHAGGMQVAASDNIYASNERWFINTDGAGNACGLALNFSSVEFLMLEVENKNGQLFSALSYLKKNLNLSMQGNYRAKVTFENGDFYARKARAMEVEDLSGIIIDGMMPDFIAEFARNKILNLTVGDVSYGTYDLTRSRDGIPKLFDCMRDTTKWDITASMRLRH